jgi:hypothetical protein
MRSIGAKRFNQGRNTVRYDMAFIRWRECLLNGLDFWYNKWAGGDKEDALAK